MTHDPYQWRRGAGDEMTLVPRGALFAERLDAFLRHLYHASGHYHQVMAERGFYSPFSDPLAVFDRLPATDKSRYREDLQAEALEGLSGRNHVICDHSSGSTAACVLRLSTPADELAEQAVTETAFRMAGMGPGDHFLCMEVGMPEIYDFYFRAARALGVRRTTFLHLTNRYGWSLAPFKSLAPTVVLTLPSLLARAWPHLESLWPQGASPIKSVIHMGEAIHPELKEMVSRGWGCGIYSFYGTTEVGGAAGECVAQDGLHFDPAMTLLTLEHPTPGADGWMRGEALLSTLHFRSQAVLKYRVGDVLEVTHAPCLCGASTPRLRFLRRTSDSFIITGVKFRFEAILEGLREVEPALTVAALHLRDVGEDEGNTLLQVNLPDRYAASKDDFLDMLQHGIHELDALFRLGLVDFELCFLSDQDFDRRKIRKVVDARRHVSKG